MPKLKGIKPIPKNKVKICINEKILSFAFLLIEDRQIPCNIGKQVAEQNRNIIKVVTNEKDLLSGIKIEIKIDKI